MRFLILVLALGALGWSGGARHGEAEAGWAALAGLGLLVAGMRALVPRYPYQGEASRRYLLAIVRPLCWLLAAGAAGWCIGCHEHILDDEAVMAYAVAGLSATLGTLLWLAGRR